MATWSRNQIVSYVLGVVLCFSLFWATIQNHFQSISRGVVDVRDVGVLLLITLLALLASIVTARK